MIRLKQLRHSKVIPFIKGASFEFTNGITVIRGLNRDARKARNQTNAAGKSRLIAPLMSILCRNAPISRSKINRRAFVRQSGAKVELKLDVKGTTYRLIQEMVGKKFRYHVMKNGTDLQIRTTPLAERYIAELIGLTEHEIYSTLYIDGRRPYPLQMGSDSQRLEFFTHLFRLEQYDVVRQKLLELKAELKEKAIQHQTLQGELIRLRDELKQIKWKPAFDLAKLKQERIELQEKFTSISDTLAKLTNQQSLLDRVKLLDSNIAEAQKIVGGLTTSFLEEQLELAQQWVKYEHEQKEYESSFKKLQHRLAAYRDHKGDAVDLHKKMRQLDQSVGGLSSRLEELTSKKREINTRLEEMRERYSVLKNATMPPKEVSEVKLQQQRIELQGILRLKKLLERDTNGVCPTCGTPVDVTSLKQRLAGARKKLAKIDAQISQLEDYEELMQLTEEGKQLRAQLDETAIKELDKLNNNLLSLKKKRKQISHLLESAEAVKELKTELKLLKKPTAPNKKAKFSVEECNKLLYARKQINRLVPERKKLELANRDLSNISSSNLGTDVKKTLAAHKKINRKLMKTSSRYTRLCAARRMWKTKRNEIKELKARLKKTTKAASDIKIIEALAQCYSNKGLKVQHASYLAKQWEHNMNENSSKVFTEPTTFTTTVAPNKFSIEYQRGANKTDVQDFSGAETRSFTLLAVGSLLPLLPADRRCDTIVLDELDANLSEPSKRLFATEFLPFLNTLIDKIVVVTPETKVCYPGRGVNVVKHKGVSKVVA